ncbi:hypothetical protein [Halomarina oriensis]|uniref:Uncharacterized protein n=1 Tax=Halomarina oriensis TaxID=671145 RepID=A0A6B0GXG7_9EURY|nr:hypothetical protein [Halomarina oriensis]MWG36468.1 hypothetical protein [Halomarina oriensis]
MTDSDSGYDYDREAIHGALRGLATVRLSGPVTVESLTWETGNFHVVAFHTIDATYPFAAEVRGEADGQPFYRERLRFATDGPHEGWIRHEVVRRRCGRTGGRVVHSERVGGYTPDWPVPLDTDDEGDERGFGYPHQGRFA